MIELITGLALSGLGRLQGSGSVWFLPDRIRNIFKYFAAGIITLLFFTYLFVDTSNWQWWHWLLIVIVGGGVSGWAGEGRGVGWIHGWLVRGYVKGSIDGWMKYIPTHKLPEDWQKKLATLLARGAFFSVLLIPLALFVESIYWTYIFAYPIAYAISGVWGWCMQEGFNDMDAWKWIEYTRHPFAFAVMISM